MTDHNPAPCETPEMQNRAVLVPNENGDLYQSASFAHSYESRREAERLHEYRRKQNNLPETENSPPSFALSDAVPAVIVPSEPFYGPQRAAVVRCLTCGELSSPEEGCGRCAHEVKARKDFQDELHRRGRFLLVASVIVLVILSGMLWTMTRYNREADQKAAERRMEPVSVPQLGVPQ